MTPSAALAEFVFRSLRDIDAEAPPLPDGKPTGLCWYQGHLGRDGRRRTGRHEESWFPPLASRFRAAGVAATSECAYPPPERYCDLRFEWPGLGRTWLEIKGAWRYSDARGLARNAAYRKHLHAAAADVDKLGTLPPSVADHVAMLLVGFDNDRWPIDEAGDVGIIRARTGRSWAEATDAWVDRPRPGGCRVRCWLWGRGTDLTVPAAPDAR